jgi:hypothetical protein
MRPCSRPPIAAPRQLSLLPVLTRPGRLGPDERREGVALHAALLMEARDIKTRQPLAYLASALVWRPCC